MIRRICPVCDQVMKHSHYCRNCKSWVKNPYMRDVTYFLNERHPQRERECSYHTAGRTPESRNPSGNTAGWVLQNTGGNADPGIYHASSGTGGKTHKRNRGILWAPVAIIFVTGIAFSLRFYSRITETMTVFGTGEEELYDRWGEGENFGDESLWDYEEDDRAEDDWEDDGIRILEDEEVIRAGVACNGCGHFNISGEEMEEPVRQILKRYGYEIREDQIARFSNNIEYSYNQGEWFYTSYSSCISITMEKEAGKEDYADLLTMDYDTATGQLHAIHMWIGDRETMLEVSAELLELIEELSKMPKGIWSGPVKQDMPGAIDMEDGYTLDVGSLSIQGYRHEEGYWFSVGLWEEMEEP